MMTLTVSVYTAGAACQACKQTKRHLDKRGISYTEIPLDADENILDACTYLGFTHAPVVCVSMPDGTEQAWDSYRPDRIDAILPQNGHRR